MEKGHENNYKKAGMSILITYKIVFKTKILLEQR